MILLLLMMSVAHAGETVGGSYTGLRVGNTFDGSVNEGNRALATCLKLTLDNLNKIDYKNFGSLRLADSNKARTCTGISITCDWLSENESMMLVSDPTFLIPGKKLCKLMQPECKTKCVPLVVNGVESGK